MAYIIPDWLDGLSLQGTYLDVRGTPSDPFFADSETVSFHKGPPSHVSWNGIPAGPIVAGFDGDTHVDGLPDPTAANPPLDHMSYCTVVVKWQDITGDSALQGFAVYQVQLTAAGVARLVGAFAYYGGPWAKLGFGAEIAPT